jgi:hypothetical protein
MIKKILLTIGLAAILGVSAFAQTNITVTSTNTTPVKPKINVGVLSDLSSLSNIAVAPYVEYANTAKKFGFGVLAIYNVNANVGTGLGIDYLGSFTLVSGNVKFNLPLRPLSVVGLTNFLTIPYVLVGLGTPLQGAGTANGGVSTVEATGVSIPVTKLLGGNFAFTAGYANITGAGKYSGGRETLGVVWSKGF